MPAEFDVQSYKTKKNTSPVYKQLINIISLIIQNSIHTLVKSCLHFFTGKSAVERILQDFERNGGFQNVSNKNKAIFALNLYNAIANSKSKNIKECAIFLDGENTKNYKNFDQVVQTIDNLKIKSYKISSKSCKKNVKNKKKLELESGDKNSEECDLLGDGKLSEIGTLEKFESSTLKNLASLILTCYNYGFFKKVILELKHERYSTDNELHEIKLLKIWENSSIEKLNNRITKQWSYLGFQGTDPATDFRGMGRLALETMLFFTENEKNSKNFILKSNHPTTGFPFAMLVINLTSLLVELLNSNNKNIRIYLYSKTNFNLSCIDQNNSHQISLKLFCELVSKIILDFKNNFWIVKEQSDVLNFNSARAKYKSLLESGDRGGIFEKI